MPGFTAVTQLGLARRAVASLENDVRTAPSLEPPRPSTTARPLCGGLVLIVPGLVVYPATPPTARSSPRSGPAIRGLLAKLPVGALRAALVHAHNVHGPGGARRWCSEIKWSYRDSPENTLGRSGVFFRLVMNRIVTRYCDVNYGLTTH